MEKFAVVLTSNFPFGKGEDFFATELPYLRRHFDKIVILTRNRQDARTRTVPDDVAVHRFPRVGWRGRLSYFGIPFLREFWQELRALRQGGQARVTVPLVRILISFMIHGLHMGRQLRCILEQHGKLPSGEGVVLYAYWMEFPVYAALWLKQTFPGLKVICRAHGCDLYWERHALPYLPLRKHIAAHIDSAYFISDQGREYFMRKNQIQNDGRLNVAKLGVKGGSGSGRASRDGVFRILSCSHAVPVKRLDLIVRALAHIHGVDVQWTHLGDGPDLPELKLLASRLLQGHDHVEYEFKGFLSNELVFDYYRNNAVDVLVNLSSSEGLPISMMEAFSFGVPVLATAVGGVPEIVNERNGALLPPEVSPEEVAQAVLKLRGLPTGKMQALRANALETWRKSYDADANYESFVQDILAVAAPARSRPVPAAAAPRAVSAPPSMTL